MNNQMYLGIDCGLSGALALVENKKIIELVVMPVISSTKSKREYDIPGIVNFFEKYKKATVAIEKMQALPKLGTVQAFQLGRGFGILIGISSALKMRYHLIHAKTWQNAMFKDINATDTKQASAIVAKRLYPECSFLATERSKKTHSGLTDSVLICAFAQRMNL